MRVNLSKSGASLSIGHRGFWYTIGQRGRRATIGLPGTGLYWTETAPPAPHVNAGHRASFLLAVVILAALAMLFASVALAPAALAGNAHKPKHGHGARDHIDPVIAEQFEASVIGGGCPALERPRAPGEGHGDKERAARNQQALAACRQTWLKMAPIDRMGATITPDNLNVFDPTTGATEHMTPIAEQFRAYAMLCPAMNDNAEAIWRPPGRVFGAAWKAKAFEVLESCWMAFIPRA